MQSFPSRDCGSSFRHRCIQIIFVQSPAVLRDVGLGLKLLLSGLEEPGARLRTHLGQAKHHTFET